MDFEIRNINQEISLKESKFFQAPLKPLIEGQWGFGPPIINKRDFVQVWKMWREMFVFFNDCSFSRTLSNFWLFCCLWHAKLPNFSWYSLFDEIQNKCSYNCVQSKLRIFEDWVLHPMFCFWSNFATWQIVSQNSENMMFWVLFFAILRVKNICQVSTTGPSR
jgi:hypothetical protein